MPVTRPVAGRRHRPPRSDLVPSLPDLVVPLAGGLLVLAGAAGLVPPLAAVALAVAAGCTVACVRLAWLAGAPPAATEPDRPPPAATDRPPPTGTEPDRPPAAEPARTTVGSSVTGRRARRRALSRRCAAILDGAVLAAGLTVAVLPLADPSRRPPVALTGLAVTAALYAVALRKLPGRSRLAAAERLRRTVDVLSLGVSLVFTAWMLLPPGPVPPAAATTTVGGATGAAVLLVTARADRRRRPGPARCFAGAAASLAGLALLVVLFAYGAPDRAALAAAPPLLAGALLTADGARRTAAGERPRPSGFPAVWPALTAPAGIAALAAGHHLWTVGEIAAPAIALGLAVIPPMVLRELLAVADQRRHADRLARDAGMPARADVRPATDPLAALADPSDLLRGLVGRAGGALLVVDLVGADDGTVVNRPVLVEVARRLRAGCGPGDLVARLAEAEFAVLTDVGPVVAYALGSRLLAALTEPYPREGGVTRLRVGIGLAETTGGEPADVLRAAELARRRAVQLGRDRVEWYDAYLEEQLVRRLDLERELPGAIARGELDLVYQPVLTLADRQPVGTEALLRWRSPALGTVLPDELLPVAADLDLLGEVGRWVLDRACRQLADWSYGGRELWMAVNVTPRELAAPDFVARTATALAAYDVSPERLVVEVAEPAVAAELPTVVARLAGLRSLGVRTALDDFRAEHASLAQLRRLPIDLLKVGPHLVGPAPDGNRPLIDVVANLGDRLGLEVVVEGLESDVQVTGARRAGCRYGQGFALARPATAERVEAWFEEFGSAPR
ncbi:EAL domain-containing protein [Micromonospora narathiwatensis]|uniref:EAL domain, c-di-GMP-specific phosphodiesterase class I (Or its enzymatically inactive variant) n=1 Tax=Micromonospora narathiwatensis TaxID=299146 RepID=A0A1A8Z0I1_9ACTN|nr:EAL domain-containing protein [Micromonospora narathiwatensis]SBT37295.1 EAL domain, c-di-GMP-specific phosphodiesterase class I (or its enzymatically inactive variant) [Micromonospora narathiwatensis]